MKSKILFLCVILFASAFVCAQTTLTQTTLSAPVNGALPNSGTVASIQNYVVLASLTNVNGMASGLNTAINTVLFVDKEEMAVQTVQSSTKTVNVLRGYNGTQLSAHASGATVFVGSPDQFYQFDPVGACTAGNTKVTPWINTVTGNQWTCSGGTWTFSGGPYFASSLPAGPSSPNGVPQFVVSTPSGGVPGPTGFAPVGVVPRASVCTGNVDTILATDRGNYVSEFDASPCAVTLPQAGTSGFANNFTFIIKNIGAGTVTITPTPTSTIDGNANTTLTTNSSILVYSDNANYFSVATTVSLPDFTDTAGVSLNAAVPMLYTANNAAPSSTSVGLWRKSATSMCAYFGNSSFTCDVYLASGSGVSFGGTNFVAWTATTGDGSATIDTTISRVSALPGIVEIGHGAAVGSTGSIRLSGLQSVGTKFTTNNGCSDAATAGGATAGAITVGAATTSCTEVITMGDTDTALNGWACTFSDITTAADAANPHQTASTTTTVTMVSGTIAASDKISFACVGY